MRVRKAIETPGMILRAGESYTIYEEATSKGLPKISSSNDLRNFLVNEQYYPFITSKEVIYGIMLNRANRIISVEKLGEGTVSGTIADLMQLYAAALIVKASAVILSHNHPSGTLYPSEQDKKLTKQVSAALKLLDVSLLDHVIVTRDGYLSFADEGLI